MENIKEQLEEIYKHHKKTYNNSKMSKLEFVAHETFGLATYDVELDELFAKKIIEVIKVIIERKNFEYIEDKQNYINYILVCQLLDKAGWIEWGTSIRGAWLVDFRPEDAQWNLARYWCRNPDGKEIELDVPYSKNNIIALLEWVGE